MLDDIHEKSINCEILLGFLKKIIMLREEKNNPLKLLITSATIETSKL
jgi:HrpA-like RNA helicase